MPKKNRARIDYMPGQAAFDALGLASEMFPNMRPQALIDSLIITAVSAVAHDQAYKPWKPPTLSGRNRDTWTLPASLRQDRENPDHML